MDRAGRVHLAKVYRNLGPDKRLLAKLKELMGPLGCHDAAIPGWSVLDKRIPLAGTAHQSGTVRLGVQTYRSRRSMSTAVPTTLTTSTSWTPASSRRAVP